MEQRIFGSVKFKFYSLKLTLIELSRLRTKFKNNIKINYEKLYNLVRYVTHHAYFNCARHHG